ncbi:MAG TPA: hypothetical protein VKR06_43215 [Ktedonosporobacter sp.]|nr:hypothetical protein [Ktedonosporobacter sp.]
MAGLLPDYTLVSKPARFRGGAALQPQLERHRPRFQGYKNRGSRSRSRVFVLKALSEAQILDLLQRALRDNERGLGQLAISVDEDALQQIAIFANGDGRAALNVLELAARNNSDKGGHVTLAEVEDAMQHRALLYD